MNYQPSRVSSFPELVKQKSRCRKWITVVLCYTVTFNKPVKRLTGSVITMERQQLSIMSMNPLEFVPLSCSRGICSPVIFWHLFLRHHFSFTILQCNINNNFDVGINNARWEQVHVGVAKRSGRVYVAIHSRWRAKARVNIWKGKLVSAGVTQGRLGINSVYRSCLPATLMHLQGILNLPEASSQLW